MSVAIPTKRRNLEAQLLSKLLEQKVGAHRILDTFNITEILFDYYKVEFEAYVSHLNKYNETIDVTVLLNHVMTDDGDESDFIYSPQNQISIKSLVDSLREYCKRERLNNLLNTFSIEDMEADTALDSLYDAANRKLNEIGKKHYEALYDEDVYEAVCKEATSLLKAKYVTGFPELDTAFTARGLTEKELIIFKSRTGNCKTYTLVRLVVENLKRGIRCYVLSPELSKDEFLYRILQSLYGGPGFNFIEASKEFYDTYQRDRKLLEIEEGGELGRFSLDEIKRKALTIEAEIVVIDGLKYTIDPFSKIPVPDQYGINCFNLLAFSKRYRIPVICCVQENRSEAGTKVGNISGSDQISHNATAVIGIKKDTVGGSQRISFTPEKMRKGREALTFTYDWAYINNMFTYVSCEQGYGRNTQPYEIDSNVLKEVLENYESDKDTMRIVDWD